MSNDLIKQRLAEIEKQKNEAEKNRPDVVTSIVDGETADNKLKAIAEELKKRKDEYDPRAKDGGFKDNYVKDTIYIEKDIYEAFNALCLEYGDKKRYANQAFRDFVMKKHEEIKREEKGRN